MRGRDNDVVRLLAPAPSNFSLWSNTTTEESLLSELKLVVLPVCAVLHLSMLYFFFVIRRVSRVNESYVPLLFIALKIVLMNNVLAAAGNAVFLVQMASPAFSVELQHISKALMLISLSRSQLLGPLLVVCCVVCLRSQLLLPSKAMRRGIVLSLVLLPIPVAWVSIVSSAHNFELMNVMSCCFAASVCIMCSFYLRRTLRSTEKAVSLEYDTMKAPRVSLIQAHFRMHANFVQPLGILELCFLIEASFIFTIQINEEYRIFETVIVCVLRSISIIVVVLLAEHLRGDVVHNLNVFAPLPKKRKTMTPVYKLPDIQKQQEKVLRSLRQVGLFD